MIEIPAKIKLNILKNNINKFESMAVAFSGGVDSTFLLKIAHEVLGNKVIAFTAESASFPEREKMAAQRFATDHGIKHIIFESEELDIEGFSDNPPDRCYLCKKELFTKMREYAVEYKISTIAEGSNIDDNSDYRPGHRAITELTIVSPLRDAGLTKDEIRYLSKEMELPTWNKPSFACLASRFPYGERINREKLARVNIAEEYLISLGFTQIRVRNHDNLARIEVLENEIEKFLHPQMRKNIYERLKDIGFSYISMDVIGYMTGSMNETLPKH